MSCGSVAEECPSNHSSPLQDFLSAHSVIEVPAGLSSCCLTLKGMPAEAAISCRRTCLQNARPGASTEQSQMFAKSASCKDVDLVS